MVLLLLLSLALLDIFNELHLRVHFSLHGKAISNRWALKRARRFWKSIKSVPFTENVFKCFIQGS